MKTIYVKNQTRNWYVIDAENKPLGRVAAKAAAVFCSADDLVLLIQYTFEPPNEAI